MSGEEKKEKRSLLGQTQAQPARCPDSESSQ